MIIDQIDMLAGRDSGMRAQAAIQAAVSLLEAGIYVALLPLLRFLVAGDAQATLVAACVACGLALIYGILLYWSDKRGYHIGIKQVLGPIQGQVGDHIVQLPLGWFGKGRSGQVSALLTRDMQMVMNLPGRFLRELILSLVTPIAAAILFFVIDWRVGLAFIVVAPALYAEYRWMARAAGDGHLEEERTAAELSGRMIEFAQAQPALRSAGRTKTAWKALADAISDDHAATVGTLNKTSMPINVYTLTIQGIYALVLVIAALVLVAGDIGVADFAFVAIVGLRAVDALSAVGSQGMSIRVAKNALDAAQAIIDEPPLPQPGVPQAPAGSGIEFDRVSFGYDGDRTVLDGVTLSMPAKTLTALVGPSGSGKTTLTRLIARFWDVDAGAVRIGGVDVRDMDTATLMRQIALVFQDVYLFDGTIEENIRLGRPDATDAEVRRAASIAQLDEVAARLEDGWETPVGEGGMRLSGGERQRVSIARALLKDAPIVLFDEATAALDAENEAAIVGAMHELARDRTVVVIAHRLSTVASADQIAVLEDGRVTQLGTHGQLVSQPGRYASFWRERERAQGWHITG